MKDGFWPVENLIRDLEASLQVPNPMYEVMALFHNSVSVSIEIFNKLI